MKPKSTNITRFLSIILSLLMVVSVINLPTLKASAEGGVDGFVERCYTVTLDRGSDPDGFADWKDQLLNGKSVGVNIAYGFLFSTEYKNKKKSNDAYVKDLYKLFMDREPDEAGFNDWVGKLNDGKSREEVFAGFANSQEFYNICESYGITAGYFAVGYDRNQVNNVNLFVERLYQTCLGRRGDRGGQKDWVNKLLKKEITGVECARCFIQSKEYINKGLSDEDYVENMYLAMMGRASDEGGKNNWLYGLKNGMTRDEVFAGFANSKEFATICETYKINKGSYTAKETGTFDKNNPNNVPVDNNNNNQGNNNNNNSQPHNHSFDKKNTDSKYLKSSATCTDAAVYYYSCECGEMDKSKTFTSGNPLGHEWDDGVVTLEPTLSEEGSKICKCKHAGCNETKEEEIPRQNFENAKIGDIVKFGKYEQDGNEENGPEDIEWQILSIEDEQVLVISKYVLDYAQFHDKKDQKTTWKNSKIRSWLNGGYFLETAFTKREQRRIKATTLSNPNNPRFGTAGGGDTTDYVFLLNLDEVERYFGGYQIYSETDMWGYNQKLLCTPTQYALNKGAEATTMTETRYDDTFIVNPKTGAADMLFSDIYKKDVIGTVSTDWWLRSPGQYYTHACRVSGSGSCGSEFTRNVADKYGIRPALYILIDSEYKVQ